MCSANWLCEPNGRQFSEDDLGNAAGVMVKDMIGVIGMAEGIAGIDAQSLDSLDGWESTTRFANGMSQFSSTAAGGIKVGARVGNKIPKDKIRQFHLDESGGIDLSKVLSSRNPVRKVIRNAYEDIRLGKGTPRLDENGIQKVFSAKELKEISGSSRNIWEGSLEWDVRERSVNYSSFFCRSFLRISSMSHLCFGFSLSQRSGNK